MKFIIHQILDTIVRTALGLFMGAFIVHVLGRLIGLW